MDRRELLRELSRTQARWVNANTPASGDVNITAEAERRYLGQISDVFDKARRDRQRERHSAAAQQSAQAAIDAFLMAYNPNQKRDKRGRWTKGGGGAATVPPEAVPDPPSPTADAGARLRRATESGEASSRGLSGGAMASVDLVTYNDGTRAVRKVARKVPTGRSPKDQNDAEELSALVAQAIGARTPAVQRVNENQIVMEYVEDAEPGTAFAEWRMDAALKDNPDATRIGLLDVLISNPDRHPGNYLYNEEDGTVTAIDHGFAWDDLEDFYPSPFARRFGRENPLSPADVEAVRPRLEALRPEFERLGHGDWYNQMQEVFEWVASRASGTERILP